MSSCSDDGLAYDCEIRCPRCGRKWRETMPALGQIHVIVCPACHGEMTASEEDCCVFCRFGSLPCPPRQKAGRSCCSGE